MNDNYTYYANKLVDIETLHDLKVKQLVEKLKKSNILYWKDFYYDLGDIKHSYGLDVFNTLTEYIISTKGAFPLNSNLHQEKLLKFKDKCDTVFEDVCDYFEKTKGCELYLRQI